MRDLVGLLPPEDVADDDFIRDFVAEKLAADPVLSAFFARKIFAVDWLVPPSASVAGCALYVATGFTTDTPSPGFELSVASIYVAARVTVYDWAPVAKGEPGPASLMQRVGVVLDAPGNRTVQFDPGNGQLISLADRSGEGTPLHYPPISSGGDQTILTLIRRQDYRLKKDGVTKRNLNRLSAGG